MGAPTELQAPRRRATSPRADHATKDGTLLRQAASEEHRPAMANFPAIFAVLTDEVATPRARLEKLASLLLAERLDIIFCLEEPEPHIRLL